MQCRGTGKKAKVYLKFLGYAVTAPHHTDTEVSPPQIVACANWDAISLGSMLITPFHSNLYPSLPRNGGMEAAFQTNADFPFVEVVGEKAVQVQPLSLS